MKPRPNVFHVRKDSPSLAPRLPSVMVGLGVSGLFVMTASAVAPVAYDDLVIGKADTQLTLDYLLLNDKDADGNTLSITATTSPAHGTLTSLGGNSYRYTPTAGYTGRDSFTYTVSDGTGGTDTALVSLSVNAAYDVTAARNTILAGVSQLADVTGNRVAYAWGATAASISNYRGEDEANPMITAATMGSGRVVVMADSAWQNMNTLGGQFNTSTCYQNSISWVAITTNKTIPILAMTSEVSTWLTAQGYTNVTTTNATGLAAALPGKAVLIPGRFDPALSAANITAVKNYIQAGGGVLCFDGTYLPNATATILREAGISFDAGSKEDFEPPFTINRADSLTTVDGIITILKNPAAYTTADKVTAIRVAQHVINKLPADDIERARLLDSAKSSFATVTPTPQAPVTDEFQRLLMNMECAQINALPVAQMTAHRAAIPVSAAAPRVSNMTFGLAPPSAVHDTKTIYTPFYAAPGELVTIQFPTALLGKNLDVRVGHLRSAQGDTTSYPVMPVQIINFDVTSAQLQVASPHGGLIQIIVPSNVTWTGTQNITVSGAVQAPYFKLGETTDAQWVAGIRDRGTPFGVIDSPEASLVVDADKWLRTLPDPTAVITEWNYFCGKLREFYVYNPGRQLPVHHDYYAAGGVSTYPQSYGLTDEITNSLKLKSNAYSLALHEYGHICDSGNLLFDGFGETAPNLGGKWTQETVRNYAWKQYLTPARVNNYLSAQADTQLWLEEGHHAVHVKVTPFDALSAEFGPALIQQTVAAMTALPSIGTSQGKIDEWCRQLSNRSGYNLCDFFAHWRINVSASVQTELSGLPAWLPIERGPEALTVVQGTPVNFVNPSTNDFSYDGGLTLTNVSQPTSGMIVNNGDGTYTYTPAAGFTGTASFTYSVSNTTGNTFISTVPIHVVSAVNDPKLVAFDAIADGGSWKTIQLDKSYNSMVVVAQPLVGPGAPPLASRIRNATGSSFEVKLDRLDGSATPVGLTTVRILVVEEGVYNEATHGIKMEAVKFSSTATDRKGAFAGTTRDYAYTGYDHYYIPTIFGQVMSSNDTRWSSFWYKTGANSIQLGKHVGEDPVTSRASETIGYIVMEAGNYQFGQCQIQAGTLGTDLYAGFDSVNESGSSCDFPRFPALHSAQVSADVGAIDGSLDGFVAMQKIAGSNGLSAVLAEDALGDAEGVTGNEGASYLLAHHTDGSPAAKADQLTGLAGSPTLIRVLANDELIGVPTIQVTQQPANGVVTVHSDGNLIYTPNSGFTGINAFSYTVTTPQGTSTGVVTIQVVASGASQAGITADRFNSITGGSVSDLVGSANFPGNPSTHTIWSTVSSGQNVGDNLGHHLYGYVVAPTTGDYTFWISSDDSSELYLSSDGDPLKATKIASVSGYTGYQGWDEKASQKSAVISLQAGRAYFLKALHKEAGGGDHVSVAWQGPGFARKLLATPDIFTAGNNAPVLTAAPANMSINEATPTVVNLAGVFSSNDPGDLPIIEVHGNTRPDLVSASLVGNALTLSQVGLETGSAVITVRATDRTSTLVTTSFTVTVNDSVADSDGDGLTDSWEVQYFGNLAAQSGSGDPDGDGLSNAAELAAGTRPNDADSDDDGYGDAFEGIVGSNPNSANSVPQGLYANLRAWWKLDESSGSIVDDTTGRAQDGSLSGAAWSSGITGGALTFDGIDDGVLVGPSAALTGTGDFSVAAWVKVAPGSPIGTVIQQREPGGSGYLGEYMVNVNANGTVNFFIYNNGYQFDLTTAATVNDGQWHMITAVRSGTNGLVYVDGAQAAAGSGTIQPLLARAVAIGYDYRDNNKRFLGTIDDVRIYERALSAAEIDGLHDVLVPNRAPLFTTDPIVKTSATEDSAYAGTLAGNATDPDAGDSLTYSKVSGPAWLNVATTGALSGTPGNSNVGANSFTVRVTDADGLTDEAALNINVANVNDAPVFAANPFTASATEDSVFTGSITATDVDAGDSRTYGRVSGPAWLNVAANGTLSGTPSNANVGVNNFVVRVTDAGGLTEDAALNITVANVNDAPAFTANPINRPGTEDSVMTGSISAVDPDAGDSLSYSKVSGPAWLTVSSSGALSGTPTNAEVGANSFTVRVTDVGGLTNDAILNITVANVNDAPVFTVDPIISAGATVGTAYTGVSLTGQATDADAGDTLSYTKVFGPAWLSVASNGVLSGTPPAGSTGLNTFVVRATDGSNATVDAELRINVSGLPLPWVTSDVGTGMLAGSVSHSSGTFTQAGSGTMVGPADTLRFTYQTLTGDGEITAKVSSLQNTGTSSRVGVMIRETLTSNSRQAFFGLSDSGSYRWERRFSTGGFNISVSSGTGTVPNTWVRLVRTGSMITAYKSSDGVTWSLVTSGTVSMASNCYIGLAVSSGSNATLNTSQFSNVSVTP